MQIIEYRITVPLTLEEYQVAQLYTLNESLKTETNRNKFLVLNNKPFDNYPLLNGCKYASGQYTSKIYQWSSKIPNFLRTIMPHDAMEVQEEAWDAYPYCRTIITNSNYSKENFYIKIESLHADQDRGEENNVHELSEDLLRQRRVVYIDIANDPIKPKDYKVQYDPRKFHSLKTGRGPLVDPLWRRKCQPVMTCYKLVTCELRTFGLQTTFETLLQKFEKRILTNFHRQLYCLMDEWYDLKIEDVRDSNEKLDIKNVDRKNNLEEKKNE
ncbi:phosphatidylinositol transfer protein alpha isoform-like [Cochliomyia hominivorax]